MRLTGFCFMIAGLLALPPGLGQTVTTTAGKGVPGFSGDNGPATSAQIDTVYGVAVDARGNTYLADSRNHRVRKISNGVITTVAGTGEDGFSGDGKAATAAQLSFPRDVAVDAQGNLYIADSGNCRIRKVTPAGAISTLAGTGTAGFAGDGGAAAAAQLSFPGALAADSSGNLFVADTWNYRIRRISTDGKIQTVVGNGSYGPYGDGGPASAASLGLIESLAVDAQGNLYFSDSYNHVVRKVAPGGTISTVIGGGFGTAEEAGSANTANLKFPKGIAADSRGNLFVADSLNHRIRMVWPNGIIGAVAGTGTPGYSGEGAAPLTRLNSPFALAARSDGVLAFSDLWNYRVRSLGGLPASPPAIVPVIRSIADAASGQAVVTGGAWVSIYGANLAPKTETWDGSIANRQLPTLLGGVSVSVGGRPAYVSYISASQINILAPDVTPGPVQVQVNNGGTASAPVNTVARSLGPAFFLWGQYAVATHADYTLSAKPGLFPGVSTTAAKPGEWIVLWGHGFGPTDLASGVLTPSDKPHASAPTTITLGGVNAPVYGGAAVLAPGFAGLYQVGIQIPSSVPDGDALVGVAVGGLQFPDNVYLTVRR